MSPEEQITQRQNLPDFLRNRNLLVRLVIGIFVVLVLITFFVLINGSDIINPPKAVLGERSFTVAIADDPKERMKGLSGKEKFNNDRGMLFIFDKPDYYSFWMRDMKFPLDIIFIKENKIVKIYHNVQAPKNQEGLSIYQTPTPSDRVLEINAGLSKEYGFKEGQEIEFENI